MARGVYYNEWDGYAAAWLRNLIAAGHLPAGDVDERSITEVQADDLKSYVQCHFFAGIGGWARALRLVGWDDARPVWTGSCPCQPFSAAGKRKGVEDERHLWPEFRRLIAECRPPVIFGEQVASAEVVGTQLEADFVVAVQGGDFARANKLAKRLVASRSFHFSARWVDGIRADLEAEDYAFGFKVLGAHSVGAPHIRQRLWWVADSLRGRAEHAPGQGLGTQAAVDGEDGRVSGQRLRAGVEGSTGVGLADSERDSGGPGGVLPATRRQL